MLKNMTFILPVEQHISYILYSIFSHIHVLVFSIEKYLIKIYYNSVIILKITPFSFGLKKLTNNKSFSVLDYVILLEQHPKCRTTLSCTLRRSWVIVLCKNWVKQTSCKGHEKFLRTLTNQTAWFTPAFLTTFTFQKCTHLINIFGFKCFSNFAQLIGKDFFCGKSSQPMFMEVI